MSQGIFVAQGRPMLFSLGDCPKSEEIRKIVETDGGEFISSWQEGAIHLAYVEPQAPLPFPKPSDHAVYTYHFIIDSHHLGELQDLDMYELDKEEVRDGNSPRKAVRNRVKFTAKEEQAMREYMVKYPGPYTSVSYWSKATAYGLPVKRSADTLRDHCKRMMKGKTLRESSPRKPEQVMKKRKVSETQHSIHLVKPVPVTPKRSLPASLHYSPRISLPVKSSHSTPKPKSESALSDLAHTPLSLSSRFENSPALLVTVSKRGREVQDMDALKRKCLRERIPDRFKLLVERCQQRSRQPVEEAEVLQMLLQMGGSVEQTEDYFARDA